MIIMDFDGTVIDVWERYFRIFIDYWGIDKRKIDKEKFIFLKRFYNNEDELIVKLLGHKEYEEIKNYKSFKKNNLEKIEYLKLDKIIAKRDLLLRFAKDDENIILTVRRDKENFIEMLKFNNLAFLEKSCIVLNPSDVYVKKRWVEQNYLDKEKIIIGDAESDILVGKIKNSKVYFVKSGLKSKYNLKRLDVSFEIEDNVNSALSKIYV